MKTEIKTYDWPNGKRRYEIPYVNGKRYGLSRWWHENGQKEVEIPYINGQVHGIVRWWYLNGQQQYEAPHVNGQRHGLEKRWHDDGSLESSGKWHQGQVVWKIRFYFDTHIPGDAEIELFFHPTPELS